MTGNDESDKEERQGGGGMKGMGQERGNESMEEAYRGGTKRVRGCGG